MEIQQNLEYEGSKLPDMISFILHLSYGSLVPWLYIISKWLNDEYRDETLLPFLGGANDGIRLPLFNYIRHTGKV